MYLEKLKRLLTQNRTTKNVYKHLKVTEKILEVDWDMMDPNNYFRARENIFRSFQKLDLDRVNRPNPNI